MSACSPKFDWREMHGTDSPYTVLMPAKPSEQTREIRLGPQTTNMHMTASQIDGVSFAVGAAKMNDATQAQLTLAIIKSALLQKMQGQITDEKNSVTNTDGKVTFNEEFAVTSSNTNGAVSPTRMQGRLVARNEWVYQVLVVGPEKDINKESAETFLTSFKPL
ncbi:hypothetical protein AAKU67_002364 [Oxalobacteraceae bacterium GrIS 2.11]